MFNTFTFKSFPPEVIKVEHVVKDGDEYKAMHSCVHCPRLKTKCDRKLPKCSICIERNLECTYIRKKNGNKDDEPFLFNCKIKLMEDGNGKEKKNLGAFTKHRFKVPKKKNDTNLVSKDAKSMVFSLGKLNNNYTKKLELTSIYKYILGFMIDGSHIDDSSLMIFKRSDNTLEYYGFSPAGPLIVSYLNLNPITKELKLVVKNRKNVKKTPNLKFETAIINQSLLKECIDCYFRHFCILFPVLDEIFLEKKASPLLVKVVAGIGCRYLPYTSLPINLIKQINKEILTEFDRTFLKPSLEMNVIMSLILQFKVSANGFKSAWLFSSFSTIYSTQLGFNKPFPRKLKLTDREKRLRYYIWLSTCIQDKLRVFIVNRPATIQSNDWKVPFPDYPRLPKLSKSQTYSEFVMARDALSASYSISLSRLTDVIGHVDAFQKVKVINDKLNAHDNAQKLIHAALIYFRRLQSSIFKVTSCQPQWVEELSKPLLAFAALTCYTIIINVSQYFLKYQSNPKFQLYSQYILDSANIIIQVVSSQDRHFLHTYSTYSYYAITSSALSLYQILCFPPSKQEGAINLLEVKKGFEKCLQILQDHRNFSPVVVEFSDQVHSLINIRKGKNI